MKRFRLRVAGTLASRWLVDALSLGCEHPQHPEATVPVRWDPSASRRSRDPGPHDVRHVELVTNNTVEHRVPYDREGCLSQSERQSHRTEVATLRIEDIGYGTPFRTARFAYYPDVTLVVEEELGDQRLCLGDLRPVDRPALLGEPFQILSRLVAVGRGDGYRCELPRYRPQRVAVEPEL